MKPDESAADQPPSPATLPVTGLEALAEQQIQAAQAHGDFDQLANEGKPLELPPIGMLLNPEALIDQQIQHAYRTGAFDNLKGAGKPLNLEDDRFIPEDMRRMFRLMKTLHLKPLWLEIGQELQEELQHYYPWRERLKARWGQLSPIQREDSIQTMQQQLRMLNQLIHMVNANAPSDHHRLGLLVLEREQAYVMGLRP